MSAQSRWWWWRRRRRAWWTMGPRRRRRPQAAVVRGSPTLTWRMRMSAQSRWWWWRRRRRTWWTMRPHRRRRPQAAVVRVSLGRLQVKAARTKGLRKRVITWLRLRRQPRHPLRDRVPRPSRLQRANPVVARVSPASLAVPAPAVAARDPLAPTPSRCQRAIVRWALGTLLAPTGEAGLNWGSLLRRAATAARCVLRYRLHRLHDTCLPHLRRRKWQRRWGGGR